VYRGSRSRPALPVAVGDVSIRVTDGRVHGFGLDAVADDRNGLNDRARLADAARRTYYHGRRVSFQKTDGGLRS
jgi:hypothetical protein